MNNDFVKVMNIWWRW